MSRTVTKDEILDYLINNILVSVQHDIGLVIEFYKHWNRTQERGIGHFAIPRMIFPEIENLGALYSGTIKRSGQNTTRFIKDFFGKINPEYKEKGVFMYIVYRHGLSHQHGPKIVWNKGKLINWELSFSNQHLHWRKFGDQDVFIVNVEQLYKDLIEVIRTYAEEINNDNLLLIENCNKAIKEMSHPDFNDLENLCLQKYSDYCKIDDLNFINNSYKSKN